MLVEERLMEWNRLQLPYGTHFDDSVDSGARNIAGLQTWVQLLTQLVVAGGANHQPINKHKNSIMWQHLQSVSCKQSFPYQQSGKEPLAIGIAIDRGLNFIGSLVITAEAMQMKLTIHTGLHPQLNDIPVRADQESVFQYPLETPPAWTPDHLGSWHQRSTPAP